jgi:hypothetical protein
LASSIAADVPSNELIDVSYSSIAMSSCKDKQTSRVVRKRGWAWENVGALRDGDLVAGALHGLHEVVEGN